jgi:peptide-methionine (S)-S-oxide reductase
MLEGQTGLLAVNHVAVGHLLRRSRRTMLDETARRFAMRSTAIAGIGFIGVALFPVVALADESAIFAGGCFWCVEEAFDKVPGVTATTSGYTGGTVANPTYQQVSHGETGHLEAVLVEYDPAKVSYPELLEVFWRNIDPFDPAGQFCDKGTSYKSAVFVADPQERALAEQRREEIAEKFGQPVATAILDEQAFYPAEDYHQNFYQTNSARYQYYKYGCGRAQRLEEIWGKPST